MDSQLAWKEEVSVGMGAKLATFNTWKLAFAMLKFPVVQLQWARQPI